MKQEGKLTRRAFLQGTAALGAMAALSGCASQEALKPNVRSGSHTLLHIVLHQGWPLDKC